MTPPSAPAEEDAVVTPPPPPPPELITPPHVEPVTVPKLVEKPVPAKPPPAPKSMRAKKLPPPKPRQREPASPGVTEMADAGESRPGPRVPLPEAGKEAAGGNVVGPPADVKPGEQPPTPVGGGEAGAGNLFGLPAHTFKAGFKTYLVRVSEFFTVMPNPPDPTFAPFSEGPRTNRGTGGHCGCSSSMSSTNASSLPPRASSSATGFPRSKR
jgi:hypothetical protein